MRSIDIFTYHPLPFEDMPARSSIMDLDDVPVKVCAIDDLIELKQRVRREQDIIDIKMLKQIKALQPNDD